MNKNFSLLFFLKKAKALPNKTVPIYLRITIDGGSPKEISTKRYVEQNRWNSKAQKVDGKTEESRSVNEYLKTVERQVFDAYKTLLEDNKFITASVLKNKVLGITEKPQMLIPIIEQHNKDIESLIGNGYSLPTYTKYNTTKNHFIDFLKWKFKESDVALTSLQFDTISSFEFYLKSVKRIAQNTATKYVKNIKKIVQECVKKKWIKENPFSEFKPVTLETDPVFLFDYELKAIEDKEFKIERLARVRDLFVFSCYTGLAFIDVFKLTSHHIAIGIDGEKWIFTGRQKGNIPSHIPLLPAALAIISKYKNDPAATNKGKLLPMSSNQKLNGYLKEIADLCAIEKNLTYHVARHTFATTVTLCNGVPIESVSKMMGHKKLKTTQHYARVLDKKVSNDMNTLRTKFETTLQVVKDDKSKVS